MKTKPTFYPLECFQLAFYSHNYGPMMYYYFLFLGETLVIHFCMIAAERGSKERERCSYL